MLNIVIIDDDENAIRVLIKLLKKLSSFEIQITGTAVNLDDGIILIKKGHPDIVFLDINMPERNGLEIYNEFKSLPFKIIIYTAYNQYALDALKIAASGFLLKPVDFIDLQETLQKVSKEIKQEQLQHQLEENINFFNSPEITGENIIFDLENGFILVNTRNIEYCYAHNSYSGVVTYSQKEYIVTKSLHELEDILPKNQFYRTHKSYLVNIYYIRKYVHSKESYVLMKSGVKIPVSVRITSNIIDDIKKRLKLKN